MLCNEDASVFSSNSYGRQDVGKPCSFQIGHAWLAAAPLYMTVPICSVWWLSPVLRCAVQSWTDIHSFQSVFPSLLSGCHFPFGEFFSCQLYDTRRNRKNHSSTNISPGSLHHPPRNPCFCSCHLPDSPLFCFSVGRRDVVGSRMLALHGSACTQESEGEAKLHCTSEELRGGEIPSELCRVKGRWHLMWTGLGKGSGELPTVMGWFPPTSKGELGGTSQHPSHHLSLLVESLHTVCFPISL